MFGRFYENMRIIQKRIILTTREANAGDVFQIEIVPSFSGNSKRPIRFRVTMTNLKTGEITPWSINNP